MQQLLTEKFRILSLDGGGSKGVYSLGVLLEIEKQFGRPLHEAFDLIYGTSTGSIIASLIALGKSINEIQRLYFELIPKIMKHRRAKKRSEELRKESKGIFSTLKFDSFKTDIGIVATHIDYAKPMIFKSDILQAHGRKASFESGFGSTISEAVLASCAAYPFFKKVKVETTNQGNPILMDGGFVANNPTLFAIADALNGYKIPPEKINVISIGVGEYPEPSKGFFWNKILNSMPFWLARKTLTCNTNTNEIIRRILFPHIKCIRINKSFPAHKVYTHQ
ncbi:patatin-like phospholipase family protein [Leptospira noguchii]|uniref:Patatin-like phospholipase family protein n=1 Tax=Leptospira noguchii TaxID=28182 RepID=A0A9Q8RKU1_9LEPT|nr:patatin-like phospholipase family protein [Leptospira noguchii]TQE72762.1 patatin [Leptospira noguchii]UOG53237.1 patatin-like phospholipase family protein [Leptospira noguchii]UOG57199.1 patatin-like phospholipase family protein [Leptospira noguchii]